MHAMFPGAQTTDEKAVADKKADGKPTNGGGGGPGPDGKAPGAGKGIKGRMRTKYTLQTSQAMTKMMNEVRICVSDSGGMASDSEERGGSLSDHKDSVGRTLLCMFLVVFSLSESSICGPHQRERSLLEKRPLRRGAGFFICQLYPNSCRRRG